MHTILVTTAMIMAVQKQLSELADCWKTASSTVGKPETISELDEDYNF
jgi:hypothetical protein